MPLRFARLCLLGIAFAMSQRVGWSQEPSGRSAPKLPNHPAMWINSPPVTNEMLAGKAAVLYFFEETCPRCVEAWPKLLFTAGSKFEGTPVMFIAVNSGTSRPQLEAYLKKNKVTWPTICDTDRSFEREFGFNISLENTRQVRLLLPDGSFKPGDPENLEGSAVEALRDAKWKVEPKDVPPMLQPAWLAIEFGKYPDAALLLKKHLNSRGDLKEAAARLQQVVLEDLNRQLEAAKAAADEDRKWDAFKRYAAISTRFKGYTLPPEVAAQLKELANDEAIKEEQAALKILDTALQSAARSPAARKGALRQLQKLIDEHPNTEAAQEARKLLDQSAM